MARPTAPVLIAGSLLLMSAVPAASAVVIDSLVARPNPARFAGSTPPQVEIDVTIKDRGMTRILGCDLTLDLGDGSPALPLSFMDGGARKISTKHVYNKSGTYVIVTRGRAGGSVRPCEGEHRFSVTVLGEPPPHAEGATLTTTCPAGWALVPGSQSGDKFKCRPQPPASKIECAGGTKYFEQEGLIGCQ